MRRRSPEQLSLLDWQPPRTIISFPLAARLGKARQVAREIAKRTTEEGKDAAWQRHVDTLADELRRRGASAATIQAELHRFYLVCDRLLLAGVDRREG